MSDEPATRQMGAQELARALAPLADRNVAVAARPIRATRDLRVRGKLACDPVTRLGLGAPPSFAGVVEHTVEARPSTTARVPTMPDLAVVEVARAPAIDAGRKRARKAARTRALRAWHAWLIAIVLAGFALGGLVALTLHATRVTARVPPTTVREPPALPTGAPARLPATPPDSRTLGLDADERERALASALEARDVGPQAPDRRSAVHALLAGHTRSAVDALLAGHTRRALEQYQRALAASMPRDDRLALEQVVRLLERELRSCEQEAGTPCGF